MTLCMVGTGYVGLVSGACFAETGQTVVCADKDESKIQMLEGGKIPIFEPGLEEVVERSVAAGRLSFTSDVAAAIRDAEVVFPEDNNSPFTVDATTIVCINFRAIEALKKVRDCF